MFEEKHEPKLYVEHGAEELPKGAWMPVEVYSTAMTSFILVCTDAMIVDCASRTVFFPCYINKPASGLFWNIGGTLHRGREARAGMAATFFCETHLRVEPGRFRFVAVVRYWWKDRAQNPEDIGSDNLAYTYYIELSPEDRAFVAANLDVEEYDRGLRKFTREDLVREGVHQVILDTYDAIFPQRESVVDILRALTTNHA